MKKEVFIASVLVLVTTLSALSCAPDISIPDIPDIKVPSITPPAVTPPTAPPTPSPSVTPPPEPEPSITDYIAISEPRNVGDTITIDAGRLDEEIGPGLSFRWKQLHLPDKYDGLEYVTGYVADLADTESSITSFRPEYPGNYRLQLTVTGTGVSEQIQVDVPVSLPESPFEVRGVAYGMWHYNEDVQYLSEGFAKRAKADGANLIMISPVWYMKSATDTTMAPCPLNPANPEICRGVVSDENLVKMIREAHDEGLQVMVKMILNLTGPTGPEWPDIHPTNWDAWFDNWTDVCLHYGRIAEAEGVEFFAVGSELRTTVERTDNWRELIGDVRGVYSGSLTYGDNALSYGNWGHFLAWDALDYIGVHLYAPATGAYGVPEKTDPTVEEMATVINGTLTDYLDPLVEEFQKPVIFLEFSTDSYDGSNLDHFVYDPAKAVDNAEQSEYYEAGLEVLASRDYVTGVNIWCFTWIEYDASHRVNQSPIGKPAEKVMQYWFIPAE